MLVPKSTGWPAKITIVELVQLLALADSVCSKSWQSKTEIHTHIPGDFQFICRHSRISTQNKVSPLGLDILRWERDEDLCADRCLSFVVSRFHAYRCWNAAFLIKTIQGTPSYFSIFMQQRQTARWAWASSMWSVLHDDVDALRKRWTADEASQAVKTRRSAFYRNE